MSNHYFIMSSNNNHVLNSRTKAKNWCFTWNNYPRNYASYFPIDGSNYIIYGLEVGDSGTRHLQGYLQMRKQTRFSSIRRLLEGTAHWEVSRGSAEQASNYCKKDGDFKEFGKLSKTANDRRRSGLSLDCEQIRDKIQSGTSRNKLLEQFPSRGQYIDQLQQLRPHRTTAPKVLYIYSRTGKGKTTNTMGAIRELGYTFYVKPSGHKWWPRYDGQRVAILEEFQSCFTLTSFLQLCDATPFEVEFKGGFTPFTSEFLIIISNLSPEAQYQQVQIDRPQSWNAYYRRVANKHCVNDCTFDQIKDIVKDFLI